MAWAQTATLEVSTNVAYPEYQYRIRNNGDPYFWMGANTAPTENNIASFAFFAADGDNAYKIYSIDKKQWVSYDKTSNSANCKDFAKLVDTESAANAWIITEATRRVAVYQMQPIDNNGNARNQYMNWYQGVNCAGGYSYDDERTVGLWQDDAASDNGSGWILVDNTESVSEVADFENGAIYTFVTARGWMGANATANVISSAYGANNIPAADVNITNPYFQWTVYKSANNKYYLYNIGKGQFMGMQTENNAPIPFAETPAGLKMTFKNSGNTNYPIMFSIDNVGVVNHSTDRQYGLIYWNGGWSNPNDAGSNHKVVKIGVLDETTLSTIEDLVANYEETAILKMPEAGKYYRIMAVEGWNDDARYLGSKNYQGMTRAEYVANADAYTIFYFDGNYLKSYATGNYLVSNSNFLGYNGEQATGSKIGFQEDSYVAGVYNISFNDGGRWLFVQQNNYTDAGNNTGNSDGYRFNIEEVTELPVAQSGNSVYYSLADAKANVKASETLTLFVDTDEEIVLPLGVILDKNGHAADNVTVATPVAKVGEQGYESFAAAVAAAPAGGTVTLLADVTEAATVKFTKNLTFDGADHTFIGRIELGKSSGTYTIKNVKFNGNNDAANQYAVKSTSAGTELTVENCTSEGYDYGFLHLNKSVTTVLVKDVAVTGDNYGVHSVYGTNLTLENFTANNTKTAVYVQNYGERNVVLNNCSFTGCEKPLSIWERNQTKKITFNFKGVNEMGKTDFCTSAMANIVAGGQVATTVYEALNVDALATAKAGDLVKLYADTDVEYVLPREVNLEKNNFNAPNLSVEREPAGHVAYRADVTDKDDREGIAILLKEVYAKESVVVKVYNNDALMFTCTRRDIDDEGKVMFPVDGNTTANIVLWGEESGSWINEIHVAPTELNVPNKIEVYADGVLTDSYTHESGTVLGTNLEKYLALECVKKFAAKVGEDYYETLADAVAAAEAGQTVTLLKDATIATTINGAGLTIEGEGHTLTYTGSGASARAIDVKSESNGANLTVKNLTIDCTASYCQRGINYNTTGALVLDGVTVKGTNVTYALNLPGSSDNTTVTINNSSLTGNIALNVWGENSIITAENSVFTSVDNSTAENYAAVVLNNDGSTVANGTTVTINGGSITALDENGDLSNAVRNSTSTGTINVSDATTVTGIYSKPVAIVTYGSDQFYSCATLQAAIDKAIATNGSVKLIANVTASEIITVNAPVVIDGNGNTLTSTAARAINIETEGKVVINNLTVKAAERAFNIINKAATVELNDVTATANNNAVMIATSAGAANVTINGCDFTGLAVVNVAGAGAQVAINETKITNIDANEAENYGAITVYSTATNAKVTVNGGSITVADDSKKAYIFAEGATVTGVDQIGQIVAMIGDAGYETLTEAIADAKEGQTVKMVYNVNLSEILVINKAITLDGNGKKLTSTAGRAINVSGADGVTIKNLTIDAKGERAINVIQNATNVTIDGVTATAANYTVNVAGSAANAVVAIKNSTLNGLCTVNVSAAGAKVTVDESTVNCNDNNTTAGEAYAALCLNKEAVGGSIVATNTTVNVAEGSDSQKGRNGAENGSVTINGSTDDVAVMVAVITYEGSDYYHSFASLAKAVEFAKAGDVITLIRDVTGAGVVINKSITIDFNGKTYSFNEGVGSTGTESNGLQILNGNNVTLTNGTLNVDADAAGKFYILIQNYANLAVEGMTLDGTNLDKYSATDGDSYVLSNNSGTVNVIGSTIKANDEGALAFAMDACLKAPYEAPTVTVAEDVTVNGNVEVSATLNMNGTLNGAIVINGTEGTVNGAEGLTVTAMDGYNVAYADGAYTVVEKVYVAQVGEAKYETFAAAVAAAPAGGTVTLVADAVEAKTVVLTKNLTINGAGYTFTGAIEFKKSNGTFTVKNVNFNGAGTWVYALKSQTSTTNLTVEGCTATGYTYGFLYANSAIANVTVTNVTVTDVNYGVHSARGTNVTLENYKATNVKYPVYVQNYSGRNVILNNCTFDGCENPLYVWKRDGYENKITFNFKDVNEMGKADFCSSDYAIVNADAVVGTKVCGTLAEAVEAANAGETVALLRNVQLDALLTINKSITLDLGEYNITRDGRTAIYVEGDVEVTINGEGTVSGKQALYVGGGLVKVYGGNFHGLTEAVYVQHSGKAEIYGGTFSSDNVDFVLNEYDKTRETSDITVYGGTLVGFNPADNAAEGAGTNFVAEGYVVVDNGDGTYTVKENPAYGKVAKVGEEYYATLTEALAAAAAGKTVELIADVNENVTLTKSVTINGANFKYTGTMSANANITVNVLDLNFVNAGFSKSTKSTNGNYTFKNCTFDGQEGAYSRAIYVRGANKVVLENCNATGYDYFMYIPNALNNSITVKNVTVKDCGGYAVMFNSGVGKAMFENFKVNKTPTAIIYNNSADRALTLNNCTMVDVETAINHNAGEKNITCTFVGKNDLGGAAFSEYVVLNNAALAGTTIYASLAEAVAADGNVVKLLGNSTGAGVVIDEDLTIDFNGRTYTFTEGVGSTGTESNGFQILKGNTVTLKNGTLNVAAASASKFYTIIQNYATLTVEDMNLDGTNLDKWSTTDGDSYVFSNNNANVVIKGNTNITANDEGEKAFAFDADKAANVTVETTGKIAGKIEKAADATIVIYSGTYTMDVNEWCAEGYAATKVADNLWTVIKAIAQVGEVKYASIQDAIDAAQNGETVTLLANVTLTDNDVVMTKDGNKTMLYVAGKEITFDMNEKTILVENYSLGNYLLGVFCIEDGAGLTVTGNGTIDVPQLDRQVAYMFWKRGTAGYLVIENGNFHAGNLEDSMIYTNGDEVVTVNGGTFILDRTGERPNGCPWMFNTKGQNVNSIVVNGGTYNTNVSKQHYVHEAKLAEDKTMLDNGDGTWTVIEALAAIDGVGYRTLAEAVEAAAEGDYVTLLKDVTDAGIVINKSITIDFGGHTYTFNKAVGSKGTETLGLQILKGNDVTLTNGTLTSTGAVEGKEIKVLVQNYANLTLEDMNLVDATDHILYALSNNSGATYLTGNTNITTDAVAFDSYYSNSYDAPTVNVETTGTITGKIEKADGATIAISSGTFTTEIYEEWCAEYHVPVQNADGTWTVESRYIDEMTIVDDGKYTYDYVKDMTVGEFTYMRTLPAVNMWQTAYFPFEIPVEVLHEKGYEVAYFYDIHFEFNNGEINMNAAPDLHVMKISSGTLRANYPYVIKPTANAELTLKLEFEDIVLHSISNMRSVESSSTVHTFEFAGLYKRTLCSEFAGEAPCYTVTNKGEFKKVAKTVNLPSFRVYMTIKTKDGSPVILDEETAPEYIKMRVIGEENEDGTTTIYDVNDERAEEMIFDLSGRRVLETEKGIYIVNGKKVLVK